MRKEPNSRDPKDWKMLVGIILVPIVVLLVGFGVMASWNAQLAPHEVDKNTRKTVANVASKIMVEAKAKGIDPATVHATMSDFKAEGRIAREGVSVDKVVSLQSPEGKSTLASVTVGTDAADIQVENQADGSGFTVVGYHEDGKVQYYHWHSDNYNPDPEVGEGKG